MLPQHLSVLAKRTNPGKNTCFEKTRIREKKKKKSRGAAKQIQTTCF